MWNNGHCYYKTIGVMCVDVARFINIIVINYEIKYNLRILIL